MKDCCEVADVPRGQRRALQVVLAINVAMFLVESVAGWLAHSTALLADSVDMLGDALVYGVSLYVVARGSVWAARAAILKGGIMAVFGVLVVGEVVVKLAGGVVAIAGAMGGVGLLALIANSLCLAILWRRRGDDINMRSVWICSRNDVLANGAVLLAAGGVATTGAAWPDIVVGLAIAILFTSSAVVVLRDAGRALRARPQPT
jgi:Co/Zn/Cd efflux system component